MADAASPTVAASVTSDPAGPGGADERRADRRRFALASLGVWTLIALVTVAQRIVYYLHEGKPVRWWFAIESSATEWYVWAALTPVIGLLADRWPLGGPRRLRNILLHLPASVLVSVVQLFIGIALDLVLSPGAHRGETLGSHLLEDLLWRLHVSLMTYWAVLGAFVAWRNQREVRARSLAAVRLEARLAEAQLQVLRMQLNPHFLFNTLHAISALMHKNVDDADRMLSRLSDLLRQSVEGAAEQEVTLRRELDFLRPYLDIEQIRFRDRLTVVWDVAPETLDARVPHLCLQPLVENAIKHGLATVARPGRLRIAAHAVGATLRLEVEDDGKGWPRDAGGPARPGARRGIGLHNTRERLRALHGEAGRLDIGPAGDADGLPAGGDGDPGAAHPGTGRVGCRAILTLPLRQGSVTGPGEEAVA